VLVRSSIHSILGCAFTCVYTSGGGEASLLGTMSSPTLPISGGNVAAPMSRTSILFLIAQQKTTYSIRDSRHVDEKDADDHCQRFFIFFLSFAFWASIVFGWYLLGIFYIGPALLEAFFLLKIYYHDKEQWESLVD